MNSGKTSFQLRLLLIILILWTWAPPTAPAAEQDDVVYQALVQRVKDGDLTVDFRALRLACMKASHCEPRGSLADLVAMDVTDLHKVAEVSERLIEEGFVNLEAHATAAGAYARLNEPQKAQIHFAITLALMRSIMSRSDGKTKETAYEVIGDREEYAVLSALGLPYAPPEARVTHMSDGPHRYEKWDVRNPKTGQTVVVFFNIDAFLPNKSYPRDK
jgi:hypothetical protein